MAAVVLAIVALAAPAAHADYTSTVAGTTATMTGDADSDALQIDVLAFLLSHNQFPDPGYFSNLDFDTTAPVDQRLNADGTARVTINAGRGADSFTAGSTDVPAALVPGVFDFNGDDGSDSVVYEDSADTTGRTFNVRAGILDEMFIPFTGASVQFGDAESVTARLGEGDDSINVSGANAPLTINAGGGADTITIGGGHVDDITAPVDLTGGPGPDRVVFDDTAGTTARKVLVGDRTALFDTQAPVTWGAGVESATVSVGSGADTVVKNGVFPMTVNANDGDDVITVADGAGDTVDCGAGTDAVRADALDTVAANCETVDRPAGQAPPPSGGGSTTTEVRTVEVPGPTTQVAGPPVLVPVAAAVDTTPPGLTLGALHRKLTLKQALKGIKVTVTPDEPSALDVELDGVASKATLARAFNLTLARKALPLAGGPRTVTLRPSRRLVGKARRLSLQVAVTATDASGNRSRMTARLKATR